MSESLQPQGVPVTFTRPDVSRAEGHFDDFPYMMAMGDEHGSVHKISIEDAPQILPAMVEQAQSVRDKIDFNKGVNDLVQTMERLTGPKLMMKSMANKLKWIQLFNHDVTGNTRPIDVFFPNALALTQFYLHRHWLAGSKEQPRFVPITEDHRPIFMGMVRHYAKVESNE